ncbi:MAG: DUF262 domain-containing protein [Niveispirillum sp.]|uniref:DUF262 domain-containing protein n=1 Tax=Niveispirillum sp. TaxID=1917217 RepID=UPI003BA73175
MERRPTTQDITWLLDINRNGQIDLDPPYQRRSVWTKKDRQFFLDTIFRNYPSPAIFLHKSVSADGAATYHVVDGKQRLKTIFDFVSNNLRISRDFGDTRLDGKKWDDLSTFADLKSKFWNYQVPVEMIDASESNLVRNVFDRLNRNSRRLTAQELRHAKFEGWLITKAEQEAEQDEWKELGIWTRSRNSRMVDAQFISELIFVQLENRVLGFGQDELDELYAKWDDPSDIADFNESVFVDKFEESKKYLMQMDRHNKCIAHWARGVGNFYSIWCLVTLTPELPEANILAERYFKFMEMVSTLTQGDGEQELFNGSDLQNSNYYSLSSAYSNNTRGASTEYAQRFARLESLKGALILG